MFGLGKSKEEAWTGVVIKKGHGATVDEDGGRTPYWTLDVKRDDNDKTKHYIIGGSEVSVELYNSLSEGDRVSKPADTKQLQKA